MRSPGFLLLSSLVLTISLTAAAGRAHAQSSGVTKFSDDFETGTQNRRWTLTAQSYGQSFFDTAGGSASGAYHLALFGMGPNQQSSATATIVADLSGSQGAVLTFKARNPNAAQLRPGTRQVTIDNGYNRATVTTFSPAEGPALTSEWQTYSFPLDEIMQRATAGQTAGPITYTQSFLISFFNSGVGTAGQDGLLIDDLQVIDRAVAPQLTLSLPVPANLYEESGELTGQVSIFPPSATDTIVKLVATPAGAVVQLPQEIRIPAGSENASFPFQPIQDTAVNGTRTVQVQAVADGAQSSAVQTLTVQDDDGMNVRLQLPESLTEGNTDLDLNGILYLTQPAPENLTFRLTASPTGQLTAPGTLTVKKGDIGVRFTMKPVNDTKPDGDVAVTLTATGTGKAAAIRPVTGKTVVRDNDNPPLALTLTLPATVLEQSSAEGTVTLNQRPTRDLKVTVTAGPGLTVPGPAIVRANQLSATFLIIPVDNAIQEGSRTATLKAASGTATASGTVIIRDNEVARYEIERLDDIVDLTQPVPLAFSLYDVEGNTITQLPEGLSFRLLLPDGSSQPVPASTFTLQSGGGFIFSGQLTLPQTAAAPLRVVISDGSGGHATTPPFDGLRKLPLKVVEQVWDPVHARLLVSVAAGDTGAYAGKIIAIDPQTLTVTGSVSAGGVAQRLALTSDGQYLYAAVNGISQIARLKAADLSLDLTFSTGPLTPVSHQPLTVLDMATVAGQPDLLVVARAGDWGNPLDVAVFDHGQPRPVVAEAPLSPNTVLQPSPDPAIFYGLNQRSNEFGFHRLKIDAQGVTVVKEAPGLVSIFGADFRTGGSDRLFTTQGAIFDGLAMRKIADLGTTGPVLPAPDQNRVYFVDSIGGPDSSDTLNAVSAYDITTGTRLKQAKLPYGVGGRSPDVGGLVRWGQSGLAFHTWSDLVVVGAGQLVPAAGNANLAVFVSAPADNVPVGTTLSYAVQVTNQGPDPATGVVLTATLSGGQTVQSASLDGGGPVPVVNGRLTRTVGTLAAGKTATLTIRIVPPLAGRISCVGATAALTADPDYANNSARCERSATYQSALNQIQKVNLDANNLIYDAGRKKIWATVRDAAAPPFGQSLVAIDPLTGLISDPVPLGGTVADRVIALAPNGRYLYAGLASEGAVQRFDLSVSPPAVVKIAVPNHTSGLISQAAALEVLEGDGTGLLALAGGEILVYEGDQVRATGQTAQGYSSQIARTGSAGVFVVSSAGQLARVRVTSQGVEPVDTLAGDWGYARFAADGDLLLGNQGQLVDLAALVRTGETRFSGRPLADAKRNLVYQLDGPVIRAFGGSDGATLGTFYLAPGKEGDWMTQAIRWEADGFAVTGTDGFITLARWNAAASPAGSSPEADRRLADFFGLDDPAVTPLATAMQSRTTVAADGTTQLVFAFQHRDGVTTPYHYESSSDLIHWEYSQPRFENYRVGTPTAQGGITHWVETTHIPVTVAGAPVFLRLVLEDD